MMSVVQMLKWFTAACIDVAAFLVMVAGETIMAIFELLASFLGVTSDD